jgi:Uncharacterised protein family UPF0547
MRVRPGGAPMSAQSDLEKAQEHLRAGHGRRAVDAGWRAANAALLEGDAAVLRGVIEIADAVAQGSPSRVTTQAEQLASYCRLSLDGANEVVESHSILARISRMRRPRRTCPDCAEQIAAEARVCRYCGFRLDGA